MSKLKRKLGKRLLAYVLSGAMIMSNMTAFASETSQDAGGGYISEQSVDADDTQNTKESSEAEEVLDNEENDNNSNGNDDGKESSDEAAEKTEVKDSEEPEKTEASDNKQTSETESSLSVENEDEVSETDDADEKEQADEDVKNYDATLKTDVWDFGGVTVDNANNMLTASDISSLSTAGKHTFEDLNIYSSSHIEKVTLDGAGAAKFYGINGAKDQTYYSWAEITATAGDVITVDASAASGDIIFAQRDNAGFSQFQDSAGTFHINLDNLSTENTQIITTDSSKTVDTVKFYAPKDGDYLIISGNITSKSLIIARITREHVDKVTVTGAITAPEGADLSKAVLTFTDNATKEDIKDEDISSGSYSVELYDKHSYTISVSEGFEVSDDTKKLDLLKDSASHAVTLNAAAATAELSGSIKVENTISSDANLLDSLKITFIEADDTSKSVEATIDKEKKEYTAQLKTGVNYTIKSEAKYINDYELDTDNIYSDGKIVITGDTTQTIQYSALTAYPVVLSVSGKNVDGSDITEDVLKQAGARLVFTRNDSDAYEYTFKVGDVIELREGTYSVKTENSANITDKNNTIDDLGTNADKSAYITKAPIGALTVGTSNNSLAIEYQYASEWDFASTEFKNITFSDQSILYNGLFIKYAKRNGNKLYVYSYPNYSTIRVPVKGACRVTFEMDSLAEIKALNEVSGGRGNEKEISINKNGKYIYDYTGTEEGAVIVGITNSGSSNTHDGGNISKITVTYAKKINIAAAETIENGTVTLKKTTAIPGDTVKLSEVAEATPSSDDYSLDEWKVTYKAEDGTVTDVTVTGDASSGYSFTMPEADVTISATFKKLGAEYEIKLASDIDTEQGTAEAVTGEGSKSSAKAGEPVDMDTVATATPASNYILSAWEISYTDEADAPKTETIPKNSSGKYIFTMPNSVVTVKPIFARQYEIKIAAASSIENGTVTAKSQKQQYAVQGDKILLKDIAEADPAPGYEFKSWKVTYYETGGEATATVSKNDDGDDVFTMPGADVTITAVFQQAVVKYFTTTYFNQKFKDENLTAGSPVVVDGLEVLEGTAKFKYHGGQHGLDVGTANIRLTLTPDKKYDITIWECNQGNKTITATSGGNAIDVIPESADNNDPNDPQKETGSKKFTILNAQDEVTLTFSGGQAYVHSIILTENSGPAKYSVTVTDDGNGTVTINKAIAEAEEDITLTAVPNPGYALKEWNVVSPETNKPTITPDAENKNVATFKMPESNVEIQAIFESTGEDPAEIADADGFYNGLLASEPVENRKYYFDFSKQLTPAADGKNLPDTYTKGLFSYSKGAGTKNGYFHSDTYGIEFGAYNTLTFQVSGDSYIVVGGDSNSTCKNLTATSEQGTLNPDTLSTYIQGGHGTLADCKNQVGSVLAYEYTGEKGSVTLTLDEDGSKAYIVAVCIIPKKKADPSAPTYTYTFNPTNEKIADNNYVTSEGSKFFNDYFEIVDGTITGKGGKVELQNNAKSAVKFVTKETSTVSILAESTSGSNKSNLVLYKYNSTDNKWEIVDDIKEVTGSTAVTITYENVAAGTYKVAVPEEEHPHGRGVRISKIDVTEKITPETVTVNVDAPDGATGLTLVFTCRETQEVIRAAVENAKGVATLNALYTYDLMVEPTRYVITEGAELKLGAANESLTAEHNIKVESVRLRTLSGSIKGLDEDTTAMSKLKISFEKPKNKIYVPEITIDRDAKTYTAELESGVEYTIVTDGINDYELDYNASSNSDKIKITSDTAGRDITYVKKPVYKVTIAPKGATLDNLANATFTFTNLNEEGYVYTFTGPNDIALRDGTYSVKVSNSGIYVQQPTSNLTVDGAPVTKEIPFNSDITEWNFSDEEWTTEAATSNYYRGLELTNVAKNKTYALMSGGSKITIPASKAGNIIITFCYAAAAEINGKPISTTSNDTNAHETVTYTYSGTGVVEITATGTTYIEKISIVDVIPYKAEISVGAEGCDYTTINDALDAVRKMERTSDQAVTINIKPGDYEEMIVIDIANVTLKNASATPSIDLRNKGVDIDPNAVRITSYYGVGYDYYSMGSDYKWNAETLAINKANGSATCDNPPGGGTASFWNATVVITASNVSAEGIIFENSFNQYISKKAAEDIIVKQGGAKEGAVPRASMAVGDTTVQQKEYVERAAALAIANKCSQISFDNCKFISRQDTLYGGENVTASFYNCAIYGGTDYIFGAMTAVFAKCDLVFNTNDQTSSGLKNDVGYITASQTKSGHGYLMYNCHVTSTVPGVDTASQYTSKPGYLGRPWQKDTGEAVFYKTIIDEADANWQADNGKSLIMPIGWNDSLSGQSALSEEFGTYEVSGVNNSSSRATWATTHSENPYESDAAAVSAFLGGWDAFAGKDMTVVLPNDENVAAPAAPKAIVSPDVVEEGKVVKGATVTLSAETGAKVYYNVNADSDPTEAPENLYSKAIEINGNINDTVTIKAIAVKYGKTSSVATFTYTITEAATPDAPVLTPAAGTEILLGSRVMMSAAKGAAIYYNINSETAPSADAEDSKLYTGKLGVEITLDDISKTDSTTKVQAVAVLNGKTSEPTIITYNVTVNAPVADYKSGYQFPDGGGTVKLTADKDVTILYTMGSNPANPTENGADAKTYTSSGIKVKSDTTIKAVAKRGTKFSNVVTLNYIVPLSMPKAIPESGSVLPKNARTVYLQADAGAEIYYTMGENPADPTNTESNPTLYTDSGITVNEATTIKAVAIKGDRKSPVAAFTYTVTEETYPQAEKPTVTAVNGKPLEGSTVEVDADTDVVITLASATPEAIIYYTLDGDIPTASAEKYDAKNGIKISQIEEDTVVKAVATGERMLDSDILAIMIKVKPKDPEGPSGEYGEVDPSDVPSSGKIPEGLWNATVDSKNIYYTGKAIKPEVHVYDGKKRLVEGTDYTLAYKNNTKAYEKDNSVDKDVADAKKPFVTVKGKGNYSGTETIYFDIHRVSLDSPEIGANAMAVKVAGNSIKKTAPVITFNGKKLAFGETKDVYVETWPSDTDYQTPNNLENSEPYYIKVTAVAGGNFTGSIDVPLRVLSADDYKNNLASSFKVDRIDTQARTGNAVTPEPKVWAKDGTELVKDTHYTLSYRNNIEAGNATLVITGIGTYAGAKEVKFKIATTPLKNATLEDFSENEDYKGTEVKLSGYKVKMDTVTLKEGTDYTVSYKGNNKAGKATITITGKGNYSGSVKKTFAINAFDLDANKDSNDIGGTYKTENLKASYEKGGSKPKVTLTVCGHTMTEGTDFTVAYKNNAAVALSTDAKAPMITIKGKGGLTGTLTKTFTIEQQNLSEVIMTAPDVALSGQSGKYASKVTLTDINGKKLSAGSDYAKNITYERLDENGKVVLNLTLAGEETIDIGNIPNAQVRYIKATVSAPKDDNGNYTGNYQGEASVVYRVGSAANDVKKAAVTVNYGKEADGKDKKYFDYTGSEITLGKDDITVMIGKGDTATKLELNSTYKLDTYVNNVKKGNASVTVSGSGIYIGTKVVKFKIGTKNLLWDIITGGGENPNPTPGPGTGEEEPDPTPGPGDDPGKTHTIWVVGDSTVCSYIKADGSHEDGKKYYPRYGYGTQISNYETGYDVQNLAVSGTSSKSFTSNANYTTLKNGISEGDVLIIGFGHNDEKQGEDARYTNPNGDYTTEGSFAYSLYENYVKLATERKAQPILCTPIVRRSSGSSISGKNCHITSNETINGVEYPGGDYPKAIRDLGTAVNVPVVDLTALTKAYYEEIGPSNTIYLHSWSSEKESSVDNTHINIYGAKVVAHMLATELSKLSDLEISKHIANIENTPSKETDLVVNPDYDDSGSDDSGDYAPPTKTSELWKDYGIFKGSAFGAISGKAGKDNFMIEADSDKNMHIKVENDKGKIDSNVDGIAMYYYQIPADSTFTLKAKAKINAINDSKGQAAFGLMARTDMYIDERIDDLASDYVAAGTFGSNSRNCFYRKGGVLTKGSSLDSDVAKDQTYDLQLTFTGDGYACTFGDYETQSEDGYDFTLKSIDEEYQYIGMFVARNADITFSDITLIVDGEPVDIGEIEGKEDAPNDDLSEEGEEGGNVVIPETVGLKAGNTYGYKSLATFEVLEDMPWVRKKDSAGQYTDELDTFELEGIRYTFVQGSANGPSSVSIPTGKAAFKITAVADSEITFTIKVSSGKTYYYVDGTDASNLTNVKNPGTIAETSAKCTIPMKAGRTYYFYAGGSKVMVGAISIAKATASE